MKYKGSPLVVLTTPASARVEAQPYSEEVACIALGQSEEDQLAGWADATPAVRFFLSPKQHANSKVMLLRVQLGNLDVRLQPGMQVYCRVTSRGISPTAQLQTFPWDATTAAATSGSR